MKPTGPSGLTYVPQFVKPEEAETLLAWVDQQPWDTTLRRRVQHYGVRYDYQARGLGATLGPLPEPLVALAQRVETAHRTQPLTQCIVNEYTPGQGIAAHVDQPVVFGPEVVTLSLGAGCDMVFTRRRQPEDDDAEAKVVSPFTQRLAPRSLAVLTGDARYCWTHEIPARGSDRVAGRRVLRGRRVSLTFRSVVNRQP